MSDTETVDIIKELSNVGDFDLFLYSGEINTENVDALIFAARKRENRRKNVGLILTTFGGDPDDAYRLARYLKRAYEKLTLYLFGYCKSAGSLVVLAADEVVMSDFGEIGPLDIQLLKQDEMISTSALSYYQSMLMLREQAFAMFEDCFMAIKEKSQGNISTKIAADISVGLTVGMLGPVASQIDPLRLGEVARASTIALEYGGRLNENTEAVYKLTTDYCSHSFTIDLAEAKEILDNVRPPTALERKLEDALFDSVRSSCSRHPKIGCLTKDIARSENSNEEHKPDESNAQSAGGDDREDSEAVRQGLESTPAVESRRASG